MIFIVIIHRLDEFIKGLLWPIEREREREQMQCFYTFILWYCSWWCCLMIDILLMLVDIKPIYWSSCGCWWYWSHTLLFISSILLSISQSHFGTHQFLCSTSLHLSLLPTISFSFAIL